MWINPMLTIWLYGTIFSLAVIVLTLWLWYWRAPSNAESRPRGGTQSAGVRRSDSTRPRDGDAAQ